MVNKLKYQTDFLFNYSVIETVNQVIDDLDGFTGQVGGFNSVVRVTSTDELAGSLRSDVAYNIDGIIDFTGTGQNITVPVGGLTIVGTDMGISGLRCDDPNYTLFVSPQGGSGSLTRKNIFMEVAGANSKVLNLTNSNGLGAVESERIYYKNCASIGELTNYRQGFDTGVVIMGGKPELTLSGAWNGYRIDTTLVRGLSNGTVLFKEGANLTFSGRFITDVNCDLPAVGSFMNFNTSNFLLNESLVIQGAYFTRQGAVNYSDQNIVPNITKDSIKSNWSNNTGLGGTNKYLKAVCSVESNTNVAQANTYYPLNGTFLIDKAVHFDMPVMGQFRLLSGGGSFSITGDLPISGKSGATVDLRVTRSTDNGNTWQDVVGHISRVVNNFSKTRDVGFYPLSISVELAQNDRVRLEIEVLENGDTDNYLMNLDSFIVISEI